MSETAPIRTAWITGASTGIGRALALRLARNGWRVIASARSQDTLVEVAVESQTLAGTVEPLPLDVTDRYAVQTAAAHILADHGAIDLAVFNAGTHKPVSAANLNPDDFRMLVELNFLGAVNGVAAVLPAMRARGTGHIALVGSVAGYAGLPTAAAYGASKAALINMAEALKPELDAAGIRLQIVNPGFVRTPLTDRNEFSMPFLMEVDDAAERFARGLASDRFEIVFPRRLAWGLKLLRLLPYPLFFALTRRMLPRD
ncbi:MAG: SDR family NAD(P)-dependent oxidoreductase [Alphaproteobacteria bacterium]